MRKNLSESGSQLSSDDSARTRGTVGLLAGWGRFPELVAEALQRQHYRVACAGIRGHASERLQQQCDHFQWFGVARLGAHLQFFRRHGATQMTMAGKLFKARLMYGGSVWRHLPDLLCLQTLGAHFITRRKDTRDDTVLLAVTRAYLDRGIEVCPATDFAPELLVKEGIHTKRRLRAHEARDIEFGWAIAKQMGGLDIGQSITVSNQTVVAVEAVEGTDACIERSGELCRNRGFALIKVSKPDQDMRFDVPTIGPQTVERVANAGGTSIAIEADQTIVIDADEVTRLANQHGIAIVAVRNGVVSRTMAA